ncbi:endonuclease V [Lipingzhangella sp. LS1_29]|uniref:Endonuclease V n=1 Tax=Lipingzhangella rawalii TaxID=2055835 RepID=A0ABU2H1P7_9ACTN|nr:endonuclease V [Lipingzhangella rawalii]MDS1269213.1 endonuclease V [Lipingzhangella rawalii]
MPDPTPAEILADPQLWPAEPPQAMELQRRLAPQVRCEPLPARSVRLVAGLDVSYDNTRLAAAAVVMDLTTMRVVETATGAGTPRFPYVSGLFAFRELPPLLHALDGLRCRPDVLLCDGAGQAHPRRCGLACHVGVLLNRPTVGVAKSPLGTPGGVPERGRGAWASQRHGDTEVGRVLRTRSGVRPVYVSVGHRVTLEDACALTLRATPSYRLPEPIRAADQLSRRRLAEQH